ncbi:class I SAM-dependent methyltransferase [Roseiterribacter gracilis]|uniref:Methyltransferase n=1 Tax=Roseiterribacter gracilis TaxID=2812848 RepID=A0A8S8X9L2_9PROT|nr:methyltransferase [Rhodospirillales bacterium TMPK1]
MSADDVINIYERNAAGWDADRQHRRPDGEASWIKRFVAAAAPGSRILDLGCGSGEPIARDLLAAGCAVTGVDSSPSLIALCQQRFPQQDWIVADMRRLDLRRRFGGIVAWHSLFHLTQDEQASMFPIFAQHAAPGAPLLFTSGSKRDVTIGTWRGEALYHASLDASDYEALLASSGFTLIDHVVEDAACGGATVWLSLRSR